MPWQTWFVFDLGNVLIRLAYERVIKRICAQADCSRDELIRIMEQTGGYRDLERGAVTFREFHELLRRRVNYRADLATFRKVWADFFDGPVEGIEEVLARVRRQYRVAFLSNSNEVHAEVIPKKFSVFFEKDDRFIFSHRYRCAKPELALFERMLQLLGALPSHIIYVDDLLENVNAARLMGINAYQFRTSLELLTELERDGLLEPA